MSETKQHETQDPVAEEVPVEEEVSAAEEQPAEAAPVIWSQKRVPNIKKGYNPSVPFYMMGIFVALIILSVIFAKITS